MVIHCAELPDWPSIRDTYDVVLTGTERVIHQSRPTAKESVRRRDLLEGKTLFLGLDWHESDSRYPHGCWSLKVGSPSRGYSNTSTLQEHYGSTLGLQ
ncbi:hypothetical protein EDB92DRAFT_1864962 [Lactarius akahatsu]|uniref:Uncharacterized protein n=1 Tax=Lactarius akahatsu TaxID=416441 RepID=A0AAD4LFQ4_9AGAM|nr:hypothetical protein EDB92DRAFT_1864962 [Lactarius akahatsu]